MKKILFLGDSITDAHHNLGVDDRGLAMDMCKLWPMDCPLSRCMRRCWRKWTEEGTTLWRKMAFTLPGRARR